MKQITTTHMQKCFTFLFVSSVWFHFSLMVKILSFSGSVFFISFSQHIYLNYNFTICFPSDHTISIQQRRKKYKFLKVFDTQKWQLHRIQNSFRCQLSFPKPSESESESHSAAAAAKSLQSCPTLCDPIDGSPPGSPIPGILQARTLEWVAISFSNA